MSLNPSARAPGRLSDTGSSRSPSFERGDSAAYDDVLGRIGALIEGETDQVAIMATVASELHHTFHHFHWTGFYRRRADGSLIIGPYQGGHGCLHIARGRGVCGTAAEEARTIVVDDVTTFAGHIACSATTRSEIVVPVFDADGWVCAVLDVDSDEPAAFDSVDRAGLEAVAALLHTSAGPPASDPISD